MLADTKSAGIPKVPEDLTANAVDRLYETVGGLLKKGCTEVILDCSGLIRVTSTHINVLWNVREMCQERHVRLRLDDVHQNLESVLGVLDLLELFDFTPGADTPESATHDTGATSEADEFTLTFAASSNSVAEASKELRRRMSNRGLDEKIIAELETIFYEVATNIRLHSGVSRKETVQVAMSVGSREVVFVFRDAGKEFDPTSLPDSFVPSEVINRRQKRGLGVTMIRRMTDSMHYTRDRDNFNVLTLSKRLERKHE